METIATCAVCGDKKKLCRSVRINGIQQPRLCKDCLLSYMHTGKMDVNDIYWLAQMCEVGDEKSINNLKEIAKKGIESEGEKDAIAHAYR